MSDNLKIAPTWEILLLILAYVTPLVFFGYSCFTSEGHWFSRSGSLMVVFGAIVEYRNFGVQQYLREKRDETWKPRETFIKELKKRQPFDILTLSSLVIGTVIWGYGDLVFN